ncbi:MAG: hypothetical protein JWO63_397 [Frankiales bacterium]|nr:hypothetical protein [Frankiales bacterium]
MGNGRIHRPLGPRADTTHRLTVRLRHACAVLLLACGIFLVACSSSKSSQASAKDEVCTARTGVQTAFQKVVDDLKALNIGQAKTDAAAVGTAVDALAAAQSNLSDSTKAEIEPDVNALKSSLASVRSATSRSEVTAALTSAKSSFQSALQSIGDVANCS